MEDLEKTVFDSGRDLVKYYVIFDGC